jgi:hypothetical protein
LSLRNVFIDQTGESPYAFAAMRELIRRRTDNAAVVPLDLSHVRRIAGLTHVSQRALACRLGTVVLLAAPGLDPVQSDEGRR